MRRGQQPPWIVSDDLSAEIEPLLPPRPPRRHWFPGRKPLDDRKVMCGILFVLYTAIPWEYLPQELGFGSGMTCWRRLRDWNDADVWRSEPGRPPQARLETSRHHRRGRIYADRGYDFDKYRRELRAKGITPVIARRGTGHGSGLGTRRWVVEQTIALLRWFRRLRIRWEIRDDIHEAFLTLACAIICWRRLQHSKLKVARWTREPTVAG